MGTIKLAWVIGGRAVLLGSVVALSACGASASHTDNQGQDGGPDNCAEKTRRCSGLDYQTCVAQGATGATRWSTTESCPAFCDESLGCVDCPPGGTLCDGANVIGCDLNGKKTGVRVTCESACVNGTCSDPCGKAAAELSYLGCDYFPTVTINQGLIDEAHFAVAVANPQTEDVMVTVYQGDTTVTTQTVPAGDLSTITLPWVEALRRPTPAMTAQVTSGAYRLTASLPVTVYQFNPIEYLVKGCTRPDPTTGQPGPCYTFSNDASLLLPSSTLTSHYFAVARETFMMHYTVQGFTQLYKQPGFISIVNADTVPTTVNVHFMAATEASADGQIRAYGAGESGTFTLQKQGDVVQLLSAAPMKCNDLDTDMVEVLDFLGNPVPATYGYCDVQSSDLTGSEITSDHKVAVFGGHDCSFVPFNRWACDHLEQQMLPVESWGKNYLATHTTRSPPNIPDVWRVVSAIDGNVITFDPPAAHAPVPLDRGDWFEFTTPLDFQATATGPFQLVQYMVGQNYKGYGKGGNSPGDPAMALSVPVAQYRNNYIFLTPDTYTLSYVNVAAPAGMDVTLDGSSIDRTLFKPVGSTGSYQVARVKLDPGTHQISGVQGFGISVYGLAPYTSYMYPGGLDVKMINVQ